MLAVMLGTHSFHPLLCLSPHLLGGAEMSCSLPLRGSMLPYAGTGWETGQEKPQGDLIPPDLGLSLC